MNRLDATRLVLAMAKAFAALGEVCPEAVAATPIDGANNRLFRAALLQKDAIAAVEFLLKEAEVAAQDPRSVQLIATDVIRTIKNRGTTDPE